MELQHFAHIASHHLHEPLRTVNSFVGLIKQEYHDEKDEKFNVYFSFVKDSMTRMRAMIDSLLDYSRLGKGKSLQQVNIGAMVNEIEKDLELLFDEKRVKFSQINLPTISCMPNEIKQVIQNLIVNGIKFTKPNTTPELSISCKEQTGFWQFCVEDKGIGVNVEKREEIFQMFTKLHLSTEYEGHGIGLAISKKIVEIHGGKIWVESEPNEGSRFYFTIGKPF